MKISVAIASYNGEKYIEEQLQSILDQTRKVDQVIICDDCSKDDTEGVVREFIKNNKLEDSWSFEVNSSNLGYASNFIKALNKTDGDYVFFCDQDDIWIKDRVEKMVKVMEENSKVMLLGSEFEPFASTADAPKPHDWELKTFKNDESLEHLEFNAKNVFIGCQGCTMCMRRSFLDKVKDYWYAGWAHDEYVWKLALCLDGLYFYHKITLKRRLHSNNVTLHTEHKNEQRIRYLDELLSSHQQTLKFAEDIGLDEDSIHLLKRNIQATKLRLSLIKEKKIFNTIKLLIGYTDCYHKCRSIPVELMMAVRG